MFEGNFNMQANLYEVIAGIKRKGRERNRNKKRKEKTGEGKRSEDELREEEE